MNAYTIFEFVVIALIVGASANRVLRQYAPVSHRRARVWIAAKLGVTVAEAAAAEGCGSGCGTCSTGCSAGTAGAKPAESSEQVLQFHPRKG